MNKNIEDLVSKVNILDTHAMILWQIRDSRTLSIEMEKINKLIPSNCDELLEVEVRSLYEIANSLSNDELEEIIRNVNPGIIRMNLRNIQKEK